MVVSSNGHPSWCLMPAGRRIHRSSMGIVGRSARLRVLDLGVLAELVHGAHKHDRCAAAGSLPWAWWATQSLPPARQWAPSFDDGVDDVEEDLAGRAPPPDAHLRRRPFAQDRDPSCPQGDGDHRGCLTWRPALSTTVPGGMARASDVHRRRGLPCAPCGQLPTHPLPVPTRSTVPRAMTTDEHRAWWSCAAVRRCPQRADADSTIVPPGHRRLIKRLPGLAIGAHLRGWPLHPQVPRGHRAAHQPDRPEPRPPRP